MQHRIMNLIVLLGIGCLFIPCAHAGPLRIATFNVDATPAIGSPVAYALCYIGTEISYQQGGYETGPDASLVAPQVEGVLMTAMKALLK